MRYALDYAGEVLRRAVLVVNNPVVKFPAPLYKGRVGWAFAPGIFPSVSCIFTLCMLSFDDKC